MGKTYQALLKLSKEAVEAAQVPFRAKEMAAKANLEIVKLESTIAATASKVEEAKSRYPIDFDKITELLDQKALFERKHKQLKELVGELFP